MHQPKQNNEIVDRGAGQPHQKTEAERQKHERSVPYRIAAAALPILALLFSTAIVLLCFAYSKVKPFITVELGEGSPDSSVFSRGSGNVEYVTKPEALYKTVGRYCLKVKTGRLTVPVWLCVNDTVAPTATATETTVSTLANPTPDKLIGNLRDESIVKITYEIAPDYGTVGDYDAVVLLEDASGNRNRVPVTVHVRMTTDRIVAEAGDPAPEAEDFLIDRYGEVQMDPIPETVMHRPGEYPIRITADGTETESVLVVSDTVPPTGRGVTYVATPGEAILPENLVADIADETAVTASFETEPDLSSRAPQTVGVILRDLGGNETKLQGTLLITNVLPVVIEAHEGMLSVDELRLEGAYTEVSIDRSFEPNVPGMHAVVVCIDGQDNYALIEVKDTVSPTIDVYNTEGFLDHPMPAGAFASATDVTETKLEYRNEPDWTKERQNVSLLATDAAGNRSERSFALTLKADSEPPVLYGVVDRTAYVGEPIAYLAEVYAEDAVDGRTEVTVESSVEIEKAGTYDVVYTTMDTSGNRASAKCRFKLVKATATEEEVRAAAQKILAEIVTDDMVTAEKLKAVYDYVRGHVHYVGNSDKSDWRKEALRGMKTGKGDCFTFYSVTRALLDELGIEYMSVQRKGGRTRHYWTIVDIGTGWYHFDTTIAPHHKHKCFMWTNEQCKVKPYFWRYEQSKYPDIATEKFNYNEVVRLEKEGKLP